MPAQSETHRGRPKNFKKFREGESTAPTRVVALADVVEPEELLELAQSLIDEGYALSISRTRDGGALCIGFLMGGKPLKRYIAERAGWEALLEELSD